MACLHIYVLKHLPIARSAPRRTLYAATKKREELSFFSSCTQSRGRTGTGVNLLVFETSASTDSAIWASISLKRCANIRTFFLSPKFMAKKCEKLLRFEIFFDYLGLAISDNLRKCCMRCFAYCANGLELT